MKWKGITDHKSNKWEREVLTVIAHCGTGNGREIFSLISVLFYFFYPESEITQGVLEMSGDCMSLFTVPLSQSAGTHVSWYCQGQWLCCITENSLLKNMEHCNTHFPTIQNRFKDYYGALKWFVQSWLVWHTTSLPSSINYFSDLHYRMILTAAILE